MGVLGAGLFDDDFAADVRGTYRDLIAEGTSGSDATDILIRDNQLALSDSVKAPVFWLALAAAQWECGRLEPRVLEQALRVLASGSDLARWDHDPKLLAQRRGVLERLETKLRSQQPREKKIRQEYKDHCDWEVGEVVAYRLKLGPFVLLRVVGLVTDRGVSPQCELLDWVGPEIPLESEIKKLTVRHQEWPPDHHTDQFVVVRQKENELPVDRVRRLGFKIRPTVASRVTALFSWKDLDGGLTRRYRSLVESAV